jgi:hypothetical protein
LQIVGCRLAKVEAEVEAKVEKRSGTASQPKHKLKPQSASCPPRV